MGILAFLFIALIFIAWIFLWFVWPTIICYNQANKKNLFGHYNYGTDKKYTNVDALERAFVDCKNFAEVCSYSIAIPFGIGCGLGGADWDTEVRPMIERVFKDFPNDVEIWSYNAWNI